MSLVIPHHYRAIAARCVFLVASCAASCLSAAQPLEGQSKQPATLDVPAVPVEPAPAEEAVRFRVVLNAPKSLEGVVRASVDLYRWLGSDAVTPELLERLARQAEDEAREAVATEGYFSAEVTSRVGLGQDGMRTVTLSINPGPRTMVAGVDISIDGPIKGDATRAQRLGEIDAGWSLPRGSIFRQDDWDDAKSRALRRLSERDYPVPTIADSRADILPAESEARLRLRLDSGPRLRFGAVGVTGLNLYAPSHVRNLATFDYGDTWDREKATRFQRRLTASGYFASAYVELQSDAAQDDIAPVQVRVIEAPPRRLELGAGFSTDSRITTNASWRDQNLDGNGLRWHSEMRIESLRQSISTIFHFPETRGGWSPSVGAEVKKTDIQELSTTDLNLFARIRSLEERAQKEYGVQSIWEHATAATESQRSHATLFELARTWRTYDDLQSPTRGGALQLMAGAAPGALSTRGFTRFIARGERLYPLAKKLDLTLRAEVGAVLSAGRSGIPQAMLFRMGGATDLRGHAFESVGIRTGDVVSGARRYVLGSVELTRWIGDNWGAAVFLDGGDAFDSDQPFSLKTGIGVGARVRTPVGPVRADLAWPEHSRRPQLHFSVGVQF